MMKEKYTSPEVEVITFETQDVMTNSLDDGTGGGKLLPPIPNPNP